MCFKHHREPTELLKSTRANMSGYSARHGLFRPEAAHGYMDVPWPLPRCFGHVHARLSYAASAVVVDRSVMITFIEPSTMSAPYDSTLHTHSDVHAYSAEHGQPALNACKAPLI